MKKYLNDVVVIRLILIVLLVLYHAFAIYCGAWKMPEGIDRVETYWWIASFSYSFMLETFVFVSGYVFGYQVCNRFGGIVSVENCIKKKARRLLIPSIVFSILYFLCFGLKSDANWVGQIYNIINGEGHMWFLPMLFWCFVGVYLVEKNHVPHKVVIVVAVLMSIFSLQPLPLRISSAAYYFLFFYLGYFINRDRIHYEKITSKNVMLLWIIYLVVFIISKIVFRSVEVQSLESVSLFNKVAVLVTKRISQVIYSLAGTLGIFMSVNMMLNRGLLKVSQHAVKWSGYCFGVYICQQFILMPFVHNHAIVNLFGTYWLPWIGFVMALIVSVVITKLLLRTSIGRFLIG